jgi:hypothetical protein
MKVIKTILASLCFQLLMAGPVSKPNDCRGSLTKTASSIEEAGPFYVHTFVYKYYEHDTGRSFYLIVTYTKGWNNNPNVSIHSIEIK